MNRTVSTMLPILDSICRPAAPTVPVGVLAVMGSAAMVLDDRSWTAMEQAIDAVSELIKADQEYDEARADWDGVWDDDADPLAIRERFDTAVQRRRAALARVGGGA